MKRAPAARVRDESPFLVRLAWPIAAAFTIAIPLWVSAAGRESFRVPKLALFRGEGVILALLLLLVAIHARATASKRWSIRDLRVAIPLAMIGWAAVATLASPERRVSSDSLLTVVAGVAVYLVAYDCGRLRSLSAAWVVLAPALVNALAVFVETRREWDIRFVTAVVGEFSRESLLRASPVAFVGNRDDLGTLLVPAALLALASVLTEGRRHARIAFGAAATLLIVAIVATKTLSAIAALSIALLVLAFLRSWKSGAAALVLVAIVVPSVFLFYPALRQRATFIWDNLREGKLDKVVVGRIAPNLAAAGMVRDHPLLGVGPGLFAKNYYAYRIDAANRHPNLVPTSGWIDYFTEAHNDHLQTAAEAGLPGYALMLAAIFTGIASAFRRRTAGENERRMRGRLLAAPLFVAFAVLALVQFPLQTGATLQFFAVCAGLAMGWSRDALD